MSYIKKETRSKAPTHQNAPSNPKTKTKKKNHNATQIHKIQAKNDDTKLGYSSWKQAKLLPLALITKRLREALGAQWRDEMPPNKLQEVAWRVMALLS